MTARQSTERGEQVPDETQTTPGCEWNLRTALERIAGRLDPYATEDRERAAPRMAYVAIEGCGCVTGVTIDEPRRRFDVACGHWVRRGLTVERTTVEDARERLTPTCPHRDGKAWSEIACEEGAAAS